MNSFYFAFASAAATVVFAASPSVGSRHGPPRRLENVIGPLCQYAVLREAERQHWIEQGLRGQRGFGVRKRTATGTSDLEVEVDAAERSERLLEASVTAFAELLTAEWLFVATADHDDDHDDLLQDQDEKDFYNSSTTVEGVTVYQDEQACRVEDGSPDSEDGHGGAPNYINTRAVVFRELLSLRAWLFVDHGDVAKRLARTVRPAGSRSAAREADVVVGAAVDQFLLLLALAIDRVYQSIDLITATSPAAAVPRSRKTKTSTSSMTMSKFKKSKTQRLTDEVVLEISAPHEMARPHGGMVSARPSSYKLLDSRLQLRLFLRVLKAAKALGEGLLTSFNTTSTSTNDRLSEQGEGGSHPGDTVEATSSSLSARRYRMRLAAVRKLWVDRVSYAFEYPDFPLLHSPELTAIANAVGGTSSSSFAAYSSSSFLDDRLIERNKTDVTSSKGSAVHRTPTNTEETDDRAMLPLSLKPAPLELVAYCVEDIVFSNNGAGHPLHPVPDTKQKQFFRLFCVRGLLFAANYNRKFPAWHAAIALAFQAEYLHGVYFHKNFEHDENLSDQCDLREERETRLNSYAYRETIWDRALEGLKHLVVGAQARSTFLREPELHALMMYRQRLDLLDRDTGVGYFACRMPYRNLLQAEAVEGEGDAQLHPHGGGDEPGPLRASRTAVRERGARFLFQVDLYHDNVADTMVRELENAFAHHSHLMLVAKANNKEDAALVLPRQVEELSICLREKSVPSPHADYAEDDKDAVLELLFSELLAARPQHQKRQEQEVVYFSVVEIGVGAGPIEHNTRRLRQVLGSRRSPSFRFLLLDPACDNPFVVRCVPEAVFPENVIALLQRQLTMLPRNINLHQEDEKKQDELPPATQKIVIDVLSIDIDGQDFWLLKEILENVGKGRIEAYPEMVVVEHGHQFWWPALQLPLELEAVPRRTTSLSSATTKQRQQPAAKHHADHLDRFFAEQIPEVEDVYFQHGRGRTPTATEAVQEARAAAASHTRKEVNVFPATAAALQRLAKAHGYALVYYGDMDLIFLHEETVLNSENFRLQFPDQNDLKKLCQRYRLSERARKRDTRYLAHARCEEDQVVGLSRKTFEEMFQPYPHQVEVVEDAITTERDAEQVDASTPVPETAASLS